MESLHKYIKLMLEFLNVPFLVLHFSYYTSVTFLTMLVMILLSMPMIYCYQASDLWQELELVSELESDLQDTVEWGKKWLLYFNVGKTQLVLFDQTYNNGSIDRKMDGSVLEVK